MSAKVSVCRVQPAFVWEMLVGDVFAVDPKAVAADVNHRLFVYGQACVWDPGEGKVTVIKREDGYHLDLSNVPQSVRFARYVCQGMYRVRSVTGVECS